MTPIALEQYFEGEESWENFSSFYGKDWTNTRLQQSLLKKLDNRIDIAKVINYRLGEAGLEWMDRKVPALDHLTPFECLQNEATIARLKVCLMRMD